MAPVRSDVDPVAGNQMTGGGLVPKRSRAARRSPTPIRSPLGRTRTQPGSPDPMRRSARSAGRVLTTAHRCVRRRQHAPVARGGS
jgi:hypothetical protein